MANPKPVVIVGVLDERHREDGEGIPFARVDTDLGWGADVYLNDDRLEQLRKMNGRKVSITIAIEP